ncbi:MAG: hypothetical protein ABIN23_05510, partial [candidate division WOR-3 bacterium]
LSCTRYWWEEYREVQGVNWTPENSILFVEAVIRTRVYRTWEGGEGVDEYITKVYLWEVDTTGVNYRNLGLIYESYEGYSGFSYLSCGGEWVVLSGHPGGDMYAIRRDLSERRYLGKGVWADISPDGKKFVYVKPNGGGLWIKKIDGTGEHQIVNDPRANCPAWSSDGGRIAYVIFFPVNDSLIIIDTMGNFLNSYNTKIIAPDWGPIDSNAISFNNWDYGCILHLANGKIDTFYTENTWEGLFLWSPSGNLFIRNTTVIKYDGTKLFKINP